MKYTLEQRASILARIVYPLDANEVDRIMHYKRGWLSGYLAAQRDARKVKKGAKK